MLGTEIPITVLVFILSYLLRVLGCAARLELRPKKKSRSCHELENWKETGRVNEPKNKSLVCCDHLSVYNHKQVDSVRYLANVTQTSAAF